MLDYKVHTLLTLINVGSYTKTAKVLSLTQPAVSHQIKQLEQEYGIQLFHSSRKGLTMTPEGEILLRYARRMAALDDTLRQAIEDSRKRIRRVAVGITTTLGEYLVSQIFRQYCEENPDVNISIVSDTISSIYEMLSLYQLDLAIVEGSVPNISQRDYNFKLLDTDSLCLIVSPKHAFAQRESVTLEELKQEKFILRSSSAGTRTLFETHLLKQNESINNFNILIETDNISTIKELVASNLGVTIMAHSACRDETHSGKLVEVPIENMNMHREINIVYHRDFTHPEILEDLLRIYKCTV